jgi:antitoxin MazE6
MKTGISLPNELFEAAEKAARRLGMSRSQLYAKTVSEFLRRHFSVDVIEKLNQVYDKESSELDSITRALQYASLGEDDW